MPTVRPPLFYRRGELYFYAWYNDLGLRYIYDSQHDPDGHADLMAGTATGYDVKRNMDRLPDYARPRTYHKA